MTGERIRPQALQSASSSVIVKKSSSADGADEDTSSQKYSRRHLSDSDCEKSQWIKSNLDSKSAADEWRENLKELRLETNKQRDERLSVIAEKQTEMAKSRLSIKKRRLACDEKRLEIEAKKRKGLIDERKQVSGVLNVLVKKLNQSSRRKETEKLLEIVVCIENAYQPDYHLEYVLLSSTVKLPSCT